MRKCKQKKSNNKKSVPGWKRFHIKYYNFTITIF